jgi:hypothetical protein
LDERVHERRLHDLERAVSEVRACPSAASRPLPGAAEGACVAATTTRSTPRSSAGLIGVLSRVPPSKNQSASGSRPTRTELKKTGIAARRQDVVVLERLAHIVDERRIGHGRVLTRLREHDYALGAGARRDDRQRVEAAGSRFARTDSQSSQSLIVRRSGDAPRNDSSRTTGTPANSAR